MNELITMELEKLGGLFTLPLTSSFLSGMDDCMVFKFEDGFVVKIYQYINQMEYEILLYHDLKLINCYDISFNNIYVFIRETLSRVIKEEMNKLHSEKCI